MENTKRASFSIEKYYFDQVHIDMNHRKGDDLFVHFEPSGIFYSEDKTYDLSFVFTALSSKEESAKPFVEIKCVGVFNFKEVDSLDDIPEFFYRNSIAILFPYIRAYVSMVTNQANIQPVMLPTLNLASLEKPLRENTIVK
ncbi:protein-export chaperone SecB [Salegentibacter mishustinae]|uniref:protein-export chaperone SecB n=1 Tax=Salegentibacter mishustinae TaxID=270918 RepID=UPI001CE13D86|nr:protein-export chaperone SecB [Salegentibacter mishustinae]UBZ08140.1 protein-export chaperone SecB [Salegentibacter mishustinae]